MLFGAVGVSFCGNRSSGANQNTEGIKCVWRGSPAKEFSIPSNIPRPEYATLANCGWEKGL